MNKIANVEKTLWPETESSFAPCDYRPMADEALHTEAGSLTSLGSGPIGPEDIVPTAIPHDPLSSSMFLPCHYFDYAAGTSTGG